MPQDPVKEALASAKGALKTAEGKFPSKMAEKAGVGAKPAAAPPVPAPKAKPRSAGLIGDAEGVAAGIKARGEMMKGSGVEPQKMHDGGKVKEDGVKDLQKGETVLPKDKKASEKLAMEHLGKKAKSPISDAIDEEMDSKEDKKAGDKKEKKDGKKKTSDKHSPMKDVKHNFHRTETIHHKNGSHTVTHHPHPPKMGADGTMGQAEEPVSYAAPDMASLHQGMDENLGGAPEGGSPAGM
jgi:hypothetical protein